MGDRYNCIDCNKDTFKDDRDYYMLTRRVWRSICNKKDILCMECAEKRLGRPITSSDLVDCSLNRMINPYTRRIIKQEKENNHDKN